VKRLFRSVAIALLALGLFAGPAYAHVNTNDITGSVWRDTYGISSTTIFGNGTYQCGHNHPYIEIRTTLQQEFPYGSATYHDVSDTNTKVKHDPGSCPISRQVSTTCTTLVPAATYRFRVKVRVISKDANRNVTGAETVYRDQQQFHISCFE
jgi:hypothetical protein